MRRHILGAVAAVWLAAPAWAANGNIGLFFDNPPSTFCTALKCHCMATLYVFAFLQGASLPGITGCEYRVAVGPTSTTYSGCPAVNPVQPADPCYLYSEHFDPSATVLGSGAFNPVDNGTN